VLASAVRDEGTSYHYLPNGREVKAHPQAVTALQVVLSERELDFLTGKAWTTDAIYRETEARRASRLAEGCQVVEMEAAALFAVAEFRRVILGQIVYGGDLVVPEGWDGREWHKRGDDRSLLFWLAVQACLKL
jgi:uridine phosphorylase